MLGVREQRAATPMPLKSSPPTLEPLLEELELELLGELVVVVVVTFFFGATTVFFGAANEDGTLTLFNRLLNTSASV